MKKIYEKQVNTTDFKLWDELKNTIKPLIKKHIYQVKSNNYISIKNTSLPYILDLHGYTIQEAYDKLNLFIDKHIANKTKYIIVITGKGSYNKEGLIHKEIENWLSTKLFTIKIKHFEWINGNGALKIFLKS